MSYFTKEGIEKLRNDIEKIELDYEEKVRKLGSLEKGNLSESADFMRLRTEAMNEYMYNKKLFNQKINSAIIIENTEEFKNWDGSTVIRKCEVCINWDGEIETYKILGSNEGNLKEFSISCETDLAKVLLGHKVNDIIHFRGSNIVIEEIRPIEKVNKLILK